MTDDPQCGEHDFDAFLRSLDEAELGRAANREAECLWGAVMALRLIADECCRRGQPNPLPPGVFPPEVQLAFHTQSHLSN